MTERKQLNGRKGLVDKNETIDRRERREEEIEEKIVNFIRLGEGGGEKKDRQEKATNRRNKRETDNATHELERGKKKKGNEVSTRYLLR